MAAGRRRAACRALPGHRAGVEALRKTVRAAGELGIAWLTVYAFSSENWSRPKSEVSDLMGLLKLFIRRDLAELHQNGVRVRDHRRARRLAARYRSLLEEAETLTAGNTALNLVIAFNYGGRDEIVRAARKLAQAAARRATRPPRRSPPSCFADYLDTAGIPDPGSGDPHQRRAAAVEFPALAGRL